MRILKESILNRSSHSGEGFKAQRREMIEKWLKEYDIRNYTINKDFTINVNGNVYLSAIDLKEFPEYIQFGVVRGDFVCRINYLTSLRGVPRIVGGNFICSWTNLTSLEGAPEKVSGVFNCSRNKLTSLIGAPKNVGGSFDCQNNQLTSLRECPKEVGRNFYCSRNSIQFTKDDIRKACNVKGKIYII